MGELQKLLWRDRAALIFTSDVAPGSLRFLAVQQLGLRGFLHDIAAVHPEPFGVLKPIKGQYAWPFPHHEVRLDTPLDDELRRRWMNRLTPAERARIPARPLTRGEFIDFAVGAVSPAAGGR